MAKRLIRFFLRKHERMKGFYTEWSDINHWSVISFDHPLCWACAWDVYVCVCGGKLTMVTIVVMTALAGYFVD